MSHSGSTKYTSQASPPLYNSFAHYVQDLGLGAYATPQFAIAFVLGSLTTIGAVTIHSRYFKRIPTSDWVHPRLIAKRRWIKGVVTSVGDGDGFRLYHTPGLFWRWPMRLRKVPSNAKELKDETIRIRLAGVDAPEAAHFGKQAQPYAAEALTWLKNEIEGKRLWVQLIRRDQYGRIVAIPIRPPRIPLLRAPASRCVSVSLLSAGYATTYEQSGAEYGHWGKDQFLKYEAVARRPTYSYSFRAAKRGMWASKVALESPAEYKKRYRDGKADVTGNTNTKVNPEAGSGSWTRFIPFWR